MSLHGLGGDLDRDVAPGLGQYRFRPRLAVAAVAVRGDLRRMSITAGRATVTAIVSPLWVRFKLDLALLVASGVLFWLTSATATNSYSHQRARPPFR